MHTQRHWYRVNRVRYRRERSLRLYLDWARSTLESLYRCPSSWLSDNLLHTPTPLLPSLRRSIQLTVLRRESGQSMRQAERAAFPPFFFFFSSLDRHWHLSDLCFTPRSMGFIRSLAITPLNPHKAKQLRYQQAKARGRIITEFLSAIGMYDRYVQMSELSNLAVIPRAVQWTISPARNFRLSVWRAIQVRRKPDCISVLAPNHVSRSIDLIALNVVHQLFRCEVDVTHTHTADEQNSVVSTTWTTPVGHR